MTKPFEPDEIITAVGLRLGQLRQSIGERDMLLGDLRHELAALAKDVENLRKDVESLRRASLPAEPREASVVALRAGRAA